MKSRGPVCRDGPTCTWSLRACHGWLLAEAVIATALAFAALGIGVAVLIAAGKVTRAGPAASYAAIQEIRSRIETARRILHPRAVDGVHRSSCLVFEGPEGEVVAIAPGARGLVPVQLIGSRTGRAARPVAPMTVDGATGLVASGIGKGHIVVRMLIQFPDRVVLTSALSLEDRSESHRVNR